MVNVLRDVFENGEFGRTIGSEIECNDTDGCDVCEGSRDIGGVGGVNSSMTS